ncbi:hypothetical protein OG226_50845 [Streptomyces sp. NBC_01261]|uniref:hypothetical protein n=1 Tax=unclassified Streptomyces TaxID=2593676 RepID=UPI002E2D3DBA|nr:MULTISPECIES: hypothetical protein [unclassified Streptomyces]
MANQDPARDAVAQRAAHVLEQCVIGPVEVPEHMRPFMEDLVAALLRVGLPVRIPAPAPCIRQPPGPGPRKPAKAG